MKDIILKDFTRSKTYTIAVAEAMPEKNFSFKPVERVWSFMELLHHLVYALRWMQDNCVAGNQTEWKAPQVTSTKKELIAYLTQTLDVVEKELQGINFTNEKISGFYFMLEHNAHHRGQAVTYLRCCGVTPPEFPF
jgi:uncharacterized damage-inducible protein DinB